MSAYIVSKSHINALVQAGLRSGMRARFTWYTRDEDGNLTRMELRHDNADAVGQMLLDENIKSVSSRYPSDRLSELPGRTNSEYLMPFEWKPFVKQPTPLEAIKLIRCYEYQSCEHTEWDTSEAKQFCDCLKDWLISDLPGYDDAPWEWEDRSYDSAPQVTRLA